MTSTWPSISVLDRIRRVRPRSLQVADEVGRVGADLLAIEYVEGPESLEELAAEPLQRQVDDLAAELAGEPAPGCRRELGTDDRDVPLLAVQERSGEQALFHRVGEIQARVGPHVGDPPGRKKKQGAAVLGLRDARADEVLHRIGGIE